MKEYRNTSIILVFGLTVLTVLSCLAYDPQGPFDARDYTRVAGMRLEQRPLEALIEPLTAPIQVVAGAPDFRIAGACLLIWVFFGAGAWKMLAEIRSKRGKSGLAIACRGLRSAFAAAGTLTLLIFFLVMARIPGWRLVVDDPDLIVADLHSHTVKSFDGLMSVKTNLELHASCGYGLTALTEHDYLFAHDIETAADPAFERLPAFISGVEAHAEPGGMVVALCAKPHVPLVVPQMGEPDRTSWFIGHVHEDCAGTVIVVTLNRQRPEDIDRLVAAGADGFEIVNCGHPLRLELRQKLLDIWRTQGLVLVASTDWHGWSGLTWAWTVIRAPGASAFSHPQLTTAVISKLRERNRTDVIPVVAGYMGRPNVHARDFLSGCRDTEICSGALAAASSVMVDLGLGAFWHLGVSAKDRFEPGRRSPCFACRGHRGGPDFCRSFDHGTRGGKRRAFFGKNRHYHGNPRGCRFPDFLYRQPLNVAQRPPRGACEMSRPAPGGTYRSLPGLNHFPVETRSQAFRADVAPQVRFRSNGKRTTENGRNPGWMPSQSGFRKVRSERLNIGF